MKQANRIIKNMVLVFIILALSIACVSTVSAEDISLSDTVYISAVHMSDEAGLPIDSLTVGRLYPMIHAKVFVERTNKVLKNTDFSIYCGFYNNDELISIIHQEKSMPTDSGLVFDLEIPNITPLNTQYELRFFIWGGKENLVPYAESTAFLATTTETVSQENDMKKIKARITNDLNLFSKSANPQPFLDKLNPNGKFNDIDYTSKAQTNWEPSTALSNVSIMLKAYYTPENRWYSNPSLKASIDSVLADWAKNQYKSTNWWYNDIDTPNKLSIILLYPLSSEEYLPALKTLTLLGMPDVNESLAHKSSDTGGNLTDKLLTAIRISAATGDSNSMKNTVSYLLDNELSVFSQAGGGEGIMPDSSFHQHGSLLYNGSYGNVFCSGVNTLLKYLSDTEFMVSDRAINTYADFILDGHSWMFHGNGSDFSIYGRAISRKNGVGGSVKSNSLNAVNSLISNPNLTRRRELLALKENRLGASDLGFSGAKHFWTSDLTIFHRPDFYVSVRGSSKRNKNTEYMNKENSKAYYIADGATTIMRTGSEYQNIFAVWDWSNIPGTTTTYLPFEDIPSPGAEYGATEFVGGVSNGKYAVSAMDYSHNGVKAKRANFMFDEGFVATGSGIVGTVAGATVNTTLNQCLLNGEVSYSLDGTTLETLPQNNEVTLSNPKWVMHDNIGYMFNQNSNVFAKAKPRTGSWNAINSTQSDTMETKDVFALGIDHGIMPSGAKYSYTVLPNITQTTMRDYASNPSMVEIINNEKVQAVWSKTGKSLGVAFFNQNKGVYSESVTVPKSVTGFSSDLTITAAKDPCLMLLTQTENGFELCVSDPKNSTLANTKIKINRKLNGDGANILGNESEITVTFPQGTERGKTVVMNFTDIG